VAIYFVLTRRKNMPRGHIEFINARSLEWQNSVIDCLSPDIETKVLSLDQETGAASVILRIPAGWRHDGPRWLDADEEFMVLDGSLELNGKTLDMDCYAFLPAGTERRHAASADGASIIAFYSKTPAWLSQQPDPASTGENAAIIYLDTFEMPWHSEEMDPEYGDSGMRWKILRFDEKGKDVTMLVNSPAHFHPQNWSGRQEIHDCVEEMFLLSGDYIGDRGIMDAGSYFWRPAGEQHGPYGSRGGSLGLFRTLGAELTNNWTAHALKLSKTPAFDPIITDKKSLEAARKWRRPQSF
jgi:hypothetical protein